MTQQEMQAKAQELRELMAMQEELQAEISTLQDYFKMTMIAQKTDHLDAGIFKVSWQEITSSRLDTTALKKALPEIAERFIKVSSTRRFTIA